MGAGTKLEMDQFCIVTLLDTGLHKTAVLVFPVQGHIIIMRFWYLVKDATSKLTGDPMRNKYKI